jgi:hypothetical protein
MALSYASPTEHRGLHADFAAAQTEGDRGVLASLVRVVDDRRGLALAHRHVQCVDNELGTQVRFHGPTDDAAAVDIEHDR